MTSYSFTRRKTGAPVTYDPDTSTLEVDWGKGSAHTRRDAQGLYTEVLDMTGADLTRMEGAPVFLDHVQSTRAQIGVVEKVWIADGMGRARIKLSSRDDLAGYVRDIADGIIRNVSIGYSVSQWRDGTDSRGRRVRTATAWTPFEISFVGVAADPAAKVRSSDMDPEENVPETPANDNRQRNQAIRALCRGNGMTQAFTDDLTDGDGDLIAARAAVNAELERRSAATRITTRVGVDHTDPAAIVERISGALAASYRGVAPADNERDYMHRSIVELTDVLLRTRGLPTNGLPEQRFQRANGTGDLPILLNSTANRVLMAAEQAARSPTVALAKKVTAQDFRSRSDVAASGLMDGLHELPEHAEIQKTYMVESSLSMALKSWARGIDWSMRALVNNDLNAPLGSAEQFGKLVAVKEAELVVGVLSANPTMEDNTALLHADHNNLNAGNVPISEEAVSDARYAMRSQTGLDGALLNLAPKILMVGKGLETAGEKFIAAFSPVTQPDANVFQSKLTLMVEPRIGDYEWFLFADPAVAPVIQLMHLAGRESPQVETQQAWDTWGFSTRCIHHANAGPINAGWRAVYKFASGEDSNSQVF